VTGEIARYGYLAIFLLMVLESACIPIPSEVTMLFGGALVTAPFLAPEQQLEFWLVVAAGTLGNLVGSWLAYWGGYAGGRPLIDRWGRYLLIRPHEVDRAHDWFERHGQRAVFLGRLLPVVTSPTEAVRQAIVGVALTFVADLNDLVVAVYFHFVTIVVIPVDVKLIDVLAGVLQRLLDLLERDREHVLVAAAISLRRLDDLAVTPMPGYAAFDSRHRSILRK